LLSGMCADTKDTTLYACFSSVSKDNGKTWGHLKIFTEPGGADPRAEILPDGRAVFAVLGLSNLFVFYSIDGGLSWSSDSVNLGTAFDHQTFVTDEKQGIIYIAAIKGNDIYINKSLDGGISFSKPLTFRFSNLNSNTLTPVLLSDRSKLIPFMTFQRSALMPDGSQKSEWLQPGMHWLIPFNVKTTSFKTPLFIGQSCERGFPVLAVDKSEAAFKDRLYYTCSNQTNNEILFYYSSTKGRSWSSPAVVKKYHNQIKTTRNSFTGIPQVVVNSKGVVGVVSQDRTDDPEWKCQQLYFTASFDGGLTFQTPYKVSTVPSCMAIKANSWAGLRYSSGGDYLGFIAKPEGNFQVTWADSRGVLSQLYMAEIRANNNQVLYLGIVRQLLDSKFISIRIKSFLLRLFCVV
jgi:hypothetical protein